MKAIIEILYDIIKTKGKRRKDTKEKLNLLYEEVNVIFPFGQICGLSFSEIQSKYFPNLTIDDIKKIISKDHRFFIGINSDCTIKEEGVYSKEMFNKYGYFNKEYSDSHFGF